MNFQLKLNQLIKPYLRDRNVQSTQGANFWVWLTWTQGKTECVRVMVFLERTGLCNIEGIHNWAKLGWTSPWFRSMKLNNSGVLSWQRAESKQKWLRSFSAPASLSPGMKLTQWKIPSPFPKHSQQDLCAGLSELLKVDLNLLSSNWVCPMGGTNQTPESKRKDISGYFCPAFSLIWCQDSDNNPTSLRLPPLEDRPTSKSPALSYGDPGFSSCPFKTTWNKWKMPTVNMFIIF